MRHLPFVTCCLALRALAAAGQVSNAAVRDSTVPEFTAPYAAAAGFSDLSASRAGNGYREIRIWIGFGITIPDYFYRFVEHEGQVSGDAYLGWERKDDVPRATDSTNLAALMRYQNEGRCGALLRQEEFEVCHLRFVMAIPWARIWQSLDSVDIWNVPPRPPALGVELDGWTVLVETWDGARYRSWSYWVPSERGSPNERRAAYVARRAGDYDMFVWPGRHTRVTRGIVESRGDTLVLNECGGTRPWVLQLDDRPLRQAAGVSDSSGLLHLLHPFYVEVNVLRRPDFAARGWSEIPAFYAGELDVTSMWNVHPARPSDC